MAPQEQPSVACKGLCVCEPFLWPCAGSAVTAVTLQARNKFNTAVMSLCQSYQCPSISHQGKKSIYRCSARGQSFWSKDLTPHSISKIITWQHDAKVAGWKIRYDTSTNLNDNKKKNHGIWMLRTLKHNGTVLRRTLDNNFYPSSNWKDKNNHTPCNSQRA